jgi:hypothetical protein
MAELTQLLTSLTAASGSGDQPMIQVPTGATVASNADEPDPEDKLAAEFSAFRQPMRDVAILGSRNIPLPHQNLIEALAFMLVKEGNTLVTSGGPHGTNAAAIRGAMRADAQKLKVVLPQTIGRQPAEVQDQLIGVPTIIEHPEWEKLTLADASRLCNREVIDACQQLIIVLFHDSNTLHTAIEYAEENHKMVTKFYLD